MLRQLILSPFFCSLIRPMFSWFYYLSISKEICRKDGLREIIYFVWSET